MVGAGRGGAPGLLNRESAPGGAAAAEGKGA